VNAFLQGVVEYWPVVVTAVGTIVWVDRRITRLEARVELLVRCLVPEELRYYEQGGITGHGTSRSSL